MGGHTCVCVHVHVYMFTCTCSCVCGAGCSVSGVFLQCSLPHFLRWTLSLNLGLAGRSGQGFTWCPSGLGAPQHTQLFLWVLGFRHRLSGLDDKHFTGWVNSSDLIVLNPLLLDSNKNLEEFSALPMQWGLEAIRQPQSISFLASLAPGVFLYYKTSLLFPLFLPQLTSLGPSPHLWSKDALLAVSYGILLFVSPRNLPASLLQHQDCKHIIILINI